MLRSRIIPCLLIHKKGLVKTVKFKDGKYLGDPLNAVKIFNEKEVDELIVLDIDASVNKTPPDMNLIKGLANECRMPLCYGGGIKSVEQATSIINLGVEKVALSSAALENPDLCKDIGKVIGSQSVVVVIDAKKRKLMSGYDIYSHNGSRKSSWKLFDFVEKLEEIGVGEIVINSIDNDGVMGGYDIGLVEEVRKRCNMPISVFGGVGSVEDIKMLINKFGIIGAGAGSLFVFKGKYKAVLINYPNRSERKDLY
ncbi:MAG: imidazole glycerol phosphate synthase subunit HisF [Sphingobacteriales bacterium]|jgi:cyclase|nr:imidazole glycerol phosphate synthase subunit HisF [Sphingobacteriales bacterium]